MFCRYIIVCQQPAYMCELYDCKWDHMTLTNNTLCTLAFKFL